LINFFPCAFSTVVVVYIKLPYPIVLRTSLNIISFGCVVMLSNKEGTKALSNIFIATIIVLSTFCVLAAGNHADARPVPASYCRIHAFATVCQPPVSYCRIHAFATVCHTPVRPVPASYCRIHPFATVCHVRPVPASYCRIHPFATVCHVRPVPASYCRIHPFATVCHVRPVLFHVLWD
jgi:hypothetical protein